MMIRIDIFMFLILATLVTTGCLGPIETLRYQAPPAYTRQPELPVMEKIAVANTATALAAMSPKLKLTCQFCAAGLSHFAASYP